MSTTYRAGQVPGDTKALVGFLRDELRKLEEALNAAQPYAELQVLHVAPTKTRAGMVVNVDGTDLDLGSGEGVYRRSADNSAWIFLG